MAVAPSQYSQEQRLHIPIPGSGLHCLVVSGFAKFYDAGNVQSYLKGDPDDDEALVPYTVHMVVGPYWKHVRDVCPLVTRSGFMHGDSDEADATGYAIESCTWETVPGPAPNAQHVRIRLVVELKVRGGAKCILTPLAFYLTAIGTLVNP